MPDAGNGSVQLLEADPDLARGSTRAVCVRSASDCSRASIDVPRGPWSPARALAGGTNPIGLLVLDGLLVREAIVGDHPCAELLGPGDLLRAWEDRDAEVLLPAHASSGARSAGPPRRDRSGAGRSGGAVAGDLRLARRAGRPPRRAAGGDAGDRPPHARGRPPARAAVVPGRALGPRRARRRGRVSLRLPHRTLAGMVGARRPSVTTALGPADRPRRGRAPARRRLAAARRAARGRASARSTDHPSIAFERHYGA